MKIDDIKALVATIDGGSLQRAAAQLHLTQPAVTRRIQRLETTLGVTLLDRQAKPAVPTAEGRRVYEHCRRVLQAAEDLQASIHADAEPGGEFRLGVAAGIADPVLTRPLQALRERFPALELRVTTASSSDLTARLESGQLDAAVVLRAENTPPPDLPARLVGRESVQVVSLADDPLGDKTELHAVAGRDWVLNPEGCGFRAALAAAHRRADIPFTVAVETLGVPLQLSLVKLGMGLGLIPARFIGQADGVRVIEVEGFVCQLAVWVVRVKHLGGLGRAVDRLEALLGRAFR